jgi:hypothetical protein
LHHHRPRHRGVDAAVISDSSRRLESEGETCAGRHVGAVKLPVVADQMVGERVLVGPGDAFTHLERAEGLITRARFKPPLPMSPAEVTRKRRLSSPSAVSPSASAEKQHDYNYDQNYEPYTHLTSPPSDRTLGPPVCNRMTLDPLFVRGDV